MAWRKKDVCPRGLHGSREEMFDQEAIPCRPGLNVESWTREAIYNPEDHLLSPPPMEHMSMVAAHQSKPKKDCPKEQSRY
jgi:hypothetical protein